MARPTVFLSYKHGNPGTLVARRIQSGLQTIATPWWKPWTLRVFRDETDLAASPNLWERIVAALDKTEHLILIASPGAAAAPWVKKELRYWLTAGKASLEESDLDTPLNPDIIDPERHGRFSVVLAQGHIEWDHENNAFDWEKTDALPVLLKGVFKGDPGRPDIRASVANEDTPHRLTLRDGVFQQAIASLAEPIRGIEKNQLVSDDYRRYRQRMRVARWGIAALLLLMFGVLGALYVSVKLNETRNIQRQIAEVGQITARAETTLQDSSGDPGLALALYEEGSQTLAQVPQKKPAPRWIRWLLPADNNQTTSVDTSTATQRWSATVHRAVNSAFSLDQATQDSRIRLSRTQRLGLRAARAISAERVEPSVSSEHHTAELVFRQDDNTIISVHKSHPLYPPDYLMLWSQGDGDDRSVSIPLSLNGQISASHEQHNDIFIDSLWKISGNGSRFVYFNQNVGITVIGINGDTTEPVCSSEPLPESAQKLIVDRSGLKAVVIGLQTRLIYSFDTTSCQLTREPTVAINFSSEAPHEHRVKLGALSLDGRWLVVVDSISAGSSSTDVLNKALVFDLESSAIIPVSEFTHSGHITALLFSEDGSLLASAGEDGLVQIWRFVPDTVGVTRFRPHRQIILPEAVTSLALSAGATVNRNSRALVAVAMQDSGIVAIHELASRHEVARIKQLNAHRVTFSGSTTVTVAGHKDHSNYTGGDISRWQFSNATLATTMRTAALANDDYFAVTDTRDRVVLSSANGVMAVDVTSGAVVNEYPAESRYGYHIAMSEGELIRQTGVHDNTLTRSWSDDVIGYKPTPLSTLTDRTYFDNDQFFSSVADLSDDGRLGAYKHERVGEYRDQILEIVDYQTGESVYQCDSGIQIWNIDLSGDGSTVAWHGFGQHGAHVFVANVVDNHACSHAVFKLCTTIDDLTLSDDGEWLAIRYQHQSGSTTQVLRTTELTRSIAVNEDGTSEPDCPGPETIDRTKGMTLDTADSSPDLSRAQAKGGTLAFSPDNQYVAVVTVPHIRVFALADRQLVDEHVHNLHTSNPTRLKFSPDNSRLFAGFGDGGWQQTKFWVWNLELPPE